MNMNNKPNYMFSKPGLDFFFRWHWWAAHVVFVPLIIASITAAFMFTNASLTLILVSFVGGAFFWTLFEYFMHRFMFHVFSHVRGLDQLHYVIHGMHHVYPTDPLRVIFPPFLSIVVGGLLAIILALVLPLSCFFGVIAGFIAGYCWYEFVHYASHHIKWKTPWLKALKRHHLLHHHNEAFKDKNYGVTTVLWDRIFSTYLA